MTALLVLIPVSIGMGLIGLGAFFWAMRHDQFEDPEGNAWRVLDPHEPNEMKELSAERIATHTDGGDAARPP